MTSVTGARIQVDHRECAPELCRALTAEFGFSLEYVQLPVGDYCIDHTILIERKTTRDFELSIMDGRLFRQAFCLANHSDETLFIVEGASFCTDLQIDLDAVRGALISLAQTFRIPVLRTRNENETAWTMARLNEQHRRLGSRRGVLMGPPAKRVRTRKERVLRAIPGIGPKMARTLLDHFGSVAATLAASPEELLAVEGFGPAKLRTFRETVMEEHAPWPVSPDGSRNPEDIPCP